LHQLTNTEFTKTEKAILFSVGLLLFAFIIARAICVPMIGDELGTFYWYIQQGEFLPYKAHWDANNHLVNSALGIVFTTCLARQNGRCGWVMLSSFRFTFSSAISWPVCLTVKYCAGA
jgi:hypothetical protein